MSDAPCKQCGGTIHPYECGSKGCCGECNYHAALTSSAAMTERASIVAWLRSEACFTWLRRNTDGFTVGQADDLSVAISDGEHLRGDDE